MSFGYSTEAIGLRIYQQALCFDRSLDAIGLSVSNDSSYLLGDRPF